MPALRAAAASRSKKAIVAVEHRMAAGLHARENFRLGIGDFLKRIEIAEMDWRPHW